MKYSKISIWENKYSFLLSNGTIIVKINRCLKPILVSNHRAIYLPQGSWFIREKTEKTRLIAVVIKAFSFSSGFSTATYTTLTH